MRASLRLVLLHALLPATTFASDWPTYMGGPQRTGSNNVAVDPSQLQFLWQSQTDYSGAKIVGNTIIASRWSNSGSAVTAFDARTGAVRWTSPADSSWLSPPTVSGDLVSYMNGPQGSAVLNVVRLSDGQLVASRGGLDFSAAPPLMRDNGDGTADFVLAMSNGAQRLKLNGSTFTTIWDHSLILGGMVTPSMIGNTVLLAGVGQYCAIDFDTGELNTFHTTGLSGGGGSAVVVDTTASRFFIQEHYDSDAGALTAFSYNGQNNIQQLWRIGNMDQPSDPALLPNGDLIALSGTWDTNTVFRIDGTTGAIEDQAANTFQFWQTPTLTNGLVWLGSANGVSAYDTGSLDLSGHVPAALQGGLGAELNNVAVSDSFLVVQTPFGGPQGWQGIRVYAVPEPITLGVLGLGILVMIRRRRYAL